MGSVTASQLIADLKSLGIQKGDTVLFHSSLKSIGTVKPHPKTVVEAFLEVIGNEGTLVAPTLVPAYQGIRPPFNPSETPSEVGYLTEIVRTWDGALRSDHPTHSIAAIGANAEKLTENHSANGWGPNTPWGANAIGFATPWERVVDENAWILMIGVGFDKCTLLHHLQVRYLAEREGVTATTPWPQFDFNQLVKYFDSGIVKEGKLGNANCYLVRAKELVENGLRILQKNGEQLLTAPHLQEWLTLYNKIKTSGRPKAAAFKTKLNLPVSPDRIARPLHIRGVILDTPENLRIVFLVWDQLGCFRERGMAIRNKVASLVNTKAEHVILVTTHTHSGYEVAADISDEYLNCIFEAIESPIKNALKNIEPVRIGWTSVETAKIVKSRIVYLKNGQGFTEKWSNPSTWHIPTDEIIGNGPADNVARILVFERLDRSCLAVMTNLSCHNSAALLDPKISDDFFGVAMEMVEQVEKDSVALVTPGTIGDQDPTGDVVIGGNRDFKYAEQLGKRLGSYIINAIQNLEMHDICDISILTEEVEFELRDDWAELVKNVTKGSATFSKKSTSPTLSKMIEEKKTVEEITTIAIGEYAIVTAPGELFTAPGQYIREHSPYKYTSIFSLTNGKVIYIPGAEDYDYDIYGVTLSVESIVKKGTAERIRDIGRRNLLKIYNTNISKK